MNHPEKLICSSQQDAIVYSNLLHSKF